MNISSKLLQALCVGVGSLAITTSTEATAQQRLKPATEVEFKNDTTITTKVPQPKKAEKPRKIKPIVVKDKNATKNNIKDPCITCGRG